MATEAERTSVPKLDHYRVVERLRAGPLTDLYRAEQLPLKRPVLVKTLSTNILPTSPFAAALAREAALVSGLSHENILRLYDFDERQDAMWAVFEYVDGYPLDELISKVKRMSPQAVAVVALQLARALEHAHGRGIVHRDVQPRNVLVAKDGRVKLTNFSVASDERLPTAPELLEGSTGFGTPSYMSPEQVLGEAPDPRSDLFSLGVVMYELLAGQRPFDAPDSRAATQRIRHDPPPPLSGIGAVPGALDRLVQRCLQKMPSDRFYSASELVSALESFLADAEPPLERCVVADLAKAGLSSSVVSIESDRRSHAMAHRSAPTLWYAARGYSLCLLLIVIGAVGIEYASAKSRNEQPHHDSRLELVPPQSAFLRVVADPWAFVIVDGQRVETTPFANAIPLAPGVHYVRLEHPQAAVERRTVRLAPGETVLLDVKMDVKVPEPKMPTSTKVPAEPDTP